MPDLSESKLLASIARASRPWPAGVVVGPGDDMAVLALAGGALLAAVDQVVEGRHFLRGASEELIARKAIARNASDAAAMAARPVATLAACVLPASWTPARAESLFHALRRWALEFGCPLVGGDLSVHAGDDPLVLSVTILAEPWPEAVRKDPGADPSRWVVRRHRARAGDRLFVTGALGGSFRDAASGRHLRFEPRVPEARALLAAVGADDLSMIDVSDGLGRDATALVDERHQVVIDASRLPCADGCDWRAALGDGEDYELCFASSGRVPSTLPARDGGATPVREIGSVRERRVLSAPACVVVVDGAELDATGLGWEHRGAGDGREIPDGR